MLFRSSLGGQRFTTAFFADFDAATRTLSYIRAGHNVPVLRRARGELERLEAGDLPLGIRGGRNFASGSTSLLPGDLLVIFTDGVIEAINDHGEEFGEGRLLEAVRTLPPHSALATLERLTSAVDSFVGTTRQHDDITWLLLRVE